MDFDRSHLRGGRTTGNVDGAAIIDCRDPNGGIIYMQVVQEVKTLNLQRFSLSPDAEPWTPIGAGDDFPQMNSGGVMLQTSRLTPVPLTAGCSVNVYVWDYPGGQPVDPILNIDTGYLISDLHLWVEDTQSADLSAINVGNPILLGVG